nr:MAG TPA: receptor binding protein [Caudoviricetes sp.]
MKQTTLDLIKNINENTFIPATTQNELFELFQLDTVADLRKVSRNFMKVYELLEHFDNQTSNATEEKEGIVKFGTEAGNAIDAETWKQAIGQSLGGYVSKVESKEAGKWYINDLTDGKIYKCIQNHTSMSFDITKFVDITNVGLSDKVENLYSVESYAIDSRLTVGLIQKIGNVCILTLDSNELYNGRNYGDVLFNIPEKFCPKFLTPVSVGIINSASSGAAHIETNGNVVWRGARTNSALYINAVYLAK